MIKRVVMMPPPWVTRFLYKENPESEVRAHHARPGRHSGPSAAGSLHRSGVALSLTLLACGVDKRAESLLRTPHGSRVNRSLNNPIATETSRICFATSFEMSACRARLAAGVFCAHPVHGLDLNRHPLSRRPQGSESQWRRLTILCVTR